MADIKNDDFLEFLLITDQFPDNLEDYLPDNTKEIVYSNRVKTYINYRENVRNGNISKDELPEMEKLFNEILEDKEDFSSYIHYLHTKTNQNTTIIVVLTILFCIFWYCLWY